MITLFTAALLIVIALIVGIIIGSVLGYKFGYDDAMDDIRRLEGWNGKNKETR